MTATQPVSPLDRLIKKLASVKAGNAKENVPPTSHPTGSLPDGTQTPPSGPTATEQKGNVADAAQGDPVDGGKLAEGNGDKEHGLKRMMADDKPQVTPATADNDPKKLASLTTDELLAKYASVAVPAAAQLLVDTARSLSATPEVKSAAVAAPAPVAAATSTENLQAAQAGADKAWKMACQMVADTVREAEFAADLLADVTKLSITKQANLKAAAKKKAADDAAAAAASMPPIPPGAGGMPPGAGGGMPPGAEGGMPPGDPLAAAGAEGGMPPGPGGPEGGEGKMDDAQIEQLLMALLEQQGSADPKALEESAVPGTAAIGKQARAFLKQGKFTVRPAKNAHERAAIDHMKTFIRETTR